VEFDENENYVKTITAGDLRVPRSIAFKPKGATTAVADSKPVLPQRYALFQNVPNPFNPSTQIRFQAPAGSGNITLNIFDVTGRLVSTLIADRPAPGEGVVAWDGTDNQRRQVVTGIYFYQMIVDNFSATRRMVLAR
jgi:hypothetical protein